MNNLNYFETLDKQLENIFNIVVSLCIDTFLYNGIKDTYELLENRDKSFCMSDKYDVASNSQKEIIKRSSTIEEIIISLHENFIEEYSTHKNIGEFIDFINTATIENIKQNALIDKIKEASIECFQDYVKANKNILNYICKKSIARCNNFIINHKNNKPNSKTNIGFIILKNSILSAISEIKKEVKI